MTVRTRKWVLLGSVLATIALGLSGAFVARSEFRERTLARARRDGMSAYARGEYAAAMPLLSTYVGRSLTDEAAILALADCRRRTPQENQKHLVSALAFAHAAARAAPMDPQPLEMALEIAGQLGYITEMGQIADQLIKLDPASLPARAAQIRCCATIGDDKRALNAARAMAAEHPDALEARAAVVQFMRATGADSKEIRSYTARLAESHSDDLGFALLNARTAMLTAGTQAERDAAVDLVKHAATLPVHTPDELASLLKHLELLALHAEADAVLARASQDPGLAQEALLIRAERAWKLGDLEEAKKLLSDRSPAGDATAREMALRVLIGTYDPETALVAIGQSKDKDAPYWAPVLRGRTRLEAGNVKEAVASLSAAATMDAAPGFAQFFLAQALTQAGDWRAAADKYLAAAETDPIWRTARICSVSLLVEHNQFSEARKQAAAALAATHEWPEALTYATTSVAMLETGKADPEATSQILREMDGFQRTQPDSTTIAALRARALAAAGRRDEALSAAHQVLAAKDALPPESLLRLAVAIKPLDPVLATRLDEKSQQLTPTNTTADPAVARIDALISAGRWAEVKPLLPRAIADPRLSPAERARFTLALGSILDSSGDPEALPMLAGLAESRPRDISIQIALLESSCAWADESIVSATLTRIAAVAGQDSASWRLFEARRLLTFDATPANAARVIASIASIARAEPTNLRAALYLADAYIKLADQDSAGDAQRAIDSLSRCADADPSEPAIYPRLVELLQRTGQPAEASRRLAAFRRLKNLPRSLQRARAHLILAQGQHAEYSAELADLASRGDPEDRLAYAVERADAGDTETAGKLFDSLLAAGHPSPAAIAAAAEFVDTRDGLDAALSVLSRLPEPTSGKAVPSVPSPHLLRAKLFEKHQQFAQAEQILKDRTAHNTPESWADLADFYLNRDDRDQAAHAARNGLALAPKDARLLWISGALKALAGGKESSAAFAELSAAAADSPELRALTEAFKAAGNDSDKLAEALEAITRRYPASGEAWRQLITIRHLNGQRDKAADEALTASQLAPGSPRLLALATDVLAQANRLDEALVVVQKWRDASPSDAMAADLAEARIAGMRGRYDEALRILTPWRPRIIAGAERNPDALAVYAAALAGSGRQSEARSLLVDRIHSDAAWGIRYLRIAEALTDRPDDMRSWLSALDVAPTAPSDLLMSAAQEWYRLALSTQSSADLDQAGRYAKRLANAPGHRGPGNAMLAGIDQASGDSETAIQEYRAAAAELPQDADIANNLAWLLALTSPQCADEAVTIAKRAVSLSAQQTLPDGTRRHYLDTLGFTQVAARQFKDAAATYQLGLTVDPSSPNLLIGMAEACIGLGDSERARGMIDQLPTYTANAARLSPQLSTRLAAVRQHLLATP